MRFLLVVSGDRWLLYSALLCLSLPRKRAGFLLKGWNLEKEGLGLASEIIFIATGLSSEFLHVF